MRADKILKEVGIRLNTYQGNDLPVYSPLDQSEMARLRFHDREEIEHRIALSVEAFRIWREVPAPRRGELIRIFGNTLRKHKESLGRLVTLECGKILEEGKGEVQEMIDICDFAVGLSRQLYGLTIASERAQHTMEENWLPLGPIGIITAFNFPVAVWAWNAALALVCGNSVLWKPSEKTPLCALACEALLSEAIKEFEQKTGITVPEGLSQLILGDSGAGERLIHSTHIPLISATGSTRMGQIISPHVAKRFGRVLLELGGNNAVIITPSADLTIALPSVVFGAVGTAGQRCTTTRRALVHESIIDEVFERLQQAYASIQTKIGDPLKDGTLVGPLIDKQAFHAMEHALHQAKNEGGEVYFGKRVALRSMPEGFYVEPALVRMKHQTDIVLHETFAPILYVMPYSTLEEALAMHNAVPQGLSSAIFTTDIREAGYFKQHSDCGIANVNIGTSGAEIGGAFGGEKETGGGRESGSDSWKNYMRRQTSTTYFGSTPPALAQGIVFKV
ncbi:MAG: aldehyde dehydrogenase [Rickettsiales bacterium]|jgi:aldehyde dehydrogenase (NAD+)|nr:aldehyde dehydrogenase [Rickettsiales bacterium]